MKNLNSIANDLFQKIRGRFASVTIGDKDGNITNVPSDARFFDFAFTDNGQELGKVSVSLDEKNGVVVVVGKDLVQGKDETVQNNWYNFLKELRVFAKKRMMPFDVRDINKSNLNRRDYQFLATNRPGEEPMAESRMYGTHKTSYQRIGNARLAIKHTQPINVESIGGRSQKIGAIYIESPEGERFKYPYRHLAGARAMARHVSEGGNAYDDFGKYISGLSEEAVKLQKFKSYMNRSTVMAETLSGYMDTVNERIQSVKKEIHHLQKEAFYRETVANFTVPVVEEVPADVSENWIDQLTIKQFNEELKDVFPYIYKLVGEATRAVELGPDDIIDESGLQYYTGVKKHGKEYMKKAAQAGREGASQEELGRLKDKYSKAEKNTKEDIGIEEADLDEENNTHVYLNPLKGNADPKKVAVIKGRVTNKHLDDLAKKHNASREDFEWGNDKWNAGVTKEEADLDEGKNLTDTKADWRSDKSATAKNWSHNKLMKVAKHDRSAEKEIKRRIASKEYVFANEEVELDEAVLKPGPDFSLASKEYKGYVLGGEDDSDEDRRATLWGVYKNLGDGTYKQVSAVKDPKSNGKYPVSSFSSKVPFEEFKWTVDNFLAKTPEEFELEQAFEDTMGQFSDHVCEDCGNQNWRTLSEEKQKGVDGKVCWKGYKRMGTKMKGGKRVDNCVKVSEAGDANFTTADLQQLQKMNNVDDVKRRAIELITTKSRKPMKPEKVAWFKRAIASKRTPMDVIKLMYDLMLSGDGQAVIGSRGSMASNSYRRTFGDDLEEAYINSSKDAIEILSNLRKIGKSIELGQGSYDGNLAGMYVNDVYDVVTWLASNADTSDPKFKQIIAPVIELRKKAKGMERQPGSGKDAGFGNEIVNTLYPLMQWIEMNTATSKETDEYSPPTDSTQSPMTMTPEKPKLQLGEFILSYFDRESGKFPKGETAVLTAVQKDYGDQFVKPAARFIKKIESTVMARQAEQLQNSPYPQMEIIKKLAGY